MINIKNLEKYTESLNRLIVYEKDHATNEENPLHHEYFRIYQFRLIIK
jgi:hypothetical protein